MTWTSSSWQLGSSTRARSAKRPYYEKLSFFSMRQCWIIGLTRIASVQLRDLVFHHRSQIKAIIKTLIARRPACDGATRIAARRRNLDDLPYSGYDTTAANLFSPGVRLLDAIDEIGAYFAAKIDCGQGQSAFVYGANPSFAEIVRLLIWGGSAREQSSTFVFHIFQSSKTDLISLQ